MAHPAFWNMDDYTWSDLSDTEVASNGRYPKRAKMNDGSSRPVTEENFANSKSGTTDNVVPTNTSHNASAGPSKNDVKNIIITTKDTANCSVTSATEITTDTKSESTDEYTAQLMTDFVEAQCPLDNMCGDGPTVSLDSDNEMEVSLTSSKDQAVVDTKSNSEDFGTGSRLPDKESDSEDLLKRFDRPSPLSPSPISPVSPLPSEETPSTSRQNQPSQLRRNRTSRYLSYSDSESEGEPQRGVIIIDEIDEDYALSNEEPRNIRNVRNLPDVLLKEKPKPKYCLLREVFNRELGVSSPCDESTEDISFTDRFCSSLHATTRMKKLHTLQKHRRCVNTTNFSPDGDLLVSGSDDTDVIVWDWARKTPLHIVENVHRSNVFQSKFLYLNHRGQLNIATSARDGQVKLLQCGSDGGSWVRRSLAVHTKAVNKLHVTPFEPHSVFSAGEDGLILHSDLRRDAVNKVLLLEERGNAIPVYSVHSNPINAMELVVAGREKFVRLFDRRMSIIPFAQYCPTPLTAEPSIMNRTIRLLSINLTCAVYSHDGSQILGSYSDDDIYLFDTKTDIYNVRDTTRPVNKGYSFRYRGHRNSSSLKPVAFYGPKSDYIISGSDCGHIYIWDKQTESIIQWLKADEIGVVNGIEAHPRYPILASTGLDKDIKIWMPHSNSAPKYEGLHSTVMRNCAAQWQNPLFNDFLPTLFRSWRGENPLITDNEDYPYSGNVEVEGSMCTAF